MEDLQLRNLRAGEENRTGEPMKTIIKERRHLQSMKQDSNNERLKR